MRILCIFVVIVTVNAGFLRNNNGHNNQYGDVEVIRVIHSRGGGYSNGHGNVGGGSGHYKLLKIISEKQLSSGDSSQGSGSGSHGSGSPQLIKVIHEQSSSVQGSSHGAQSKVIHVIHQHNYPQPTPAYASFPQHAPLPLAQPSANYLPPQTAAQPSGNYLPPHTAAQPSANYLPPQQTSAPIPVPSYSSGPVSHSAGSYSYSSPVAYSSGASSAPAASHTQAEVQRVPAQNYGPPQ